MSDNDKTDNKNDTPVSSGSDSDTPKTENKGGSKYRGNSSERGGYKGNGGTGGYKGKSDYRKPRDGDNKSGGYNRDGGYRGNNNYNRDSDNKSGGYNRDGDNKSGDYNRDGGGYRGNNNYNRDGDNKSGGYNRDGGGYRGNNNYNRDGGYRGNNNYNRDGDNKSGGVGYKGGFKGKFDKFADNNNSYNRKNDNNSGGYNRYNDNRNDSRNNTEKPEEKKPETRSLLRLTEEQMQAVSVDAAKRLSAVKPDDLCILYEDNHLLVVVKPQNMPVQADISGDEDLLNKLKNYLKVAYDKPGDAYLGLVHRLDRPTGGVMVFAKTSKAASRLCEQIRDNVTSKKYLCITVGVPRAASGKLVHSLSKDEATNMVTVVPDLNEDGKRAELDYKVLSTLDDHALVEINLITGRTHQARVQMKTIGTPILGDTRYGSPEAKGKLALWAYELRFYHPTTNAPMVFAAYPPDEVPWNNFNIKGMLDLKYAKPSE